MKIKLRIPVDKEAAKEDARKIGGLMFLAGMIGLFLEGNINSSQALYFTALGCILWFIGIYNGGK